MHLEDRGTDTRKDRGLPFLGSYPKWPLGLDLKPETKKPIWVFYVGGRAKNLVHHALPSQADEQEEQPAAEPAL